MRPAPPGGLHRPAGSQPPPPVVRMRRSTGPRIPHLRPVPGLGVVVEATSAPSRAALGLPFDSVRRWLLGPRQRGSGGSGSWARRRLGGEAEGMAATPEAVYPRCHRGPERRCPQPRSPASRGRCASGGTRPRRRARSPGAPRADRAARPRGSRPPAKDPHAAASRSHGRRKVPRRLARRRTIEVRACLPPSTEASPRTVSRAGVVAARWLRRLEAHRVIGAGSETVTTGGGIGLRSGGFEPSRNPAGRAPILGGSPACLGLAASILSLLRRSDRRVRPLPGRRGAQPSLRPRGSFRLDRSAPAHPSACLGLDRSGWIARAAGALLCLHTTDGTTAPARGVEAGGAIIASRPAHRAVLPRG